jgi:hypothetical protein
MHLTIYDVRIYSQCSLHHVAGGNPALKVAGLTETWR